MAYWLFKLVEQERYPDAPGEKYVYDNTHSVRVTAGDTFVCLDKRKGYAFSAIGTVQKLTKRKPDSRESQRTSKVRTVFTAHLGDVIWFEEPLSISPVTKIGRSNRAKLGIIDVNLLGWSQSMPSLSESMYQSILDLADAEKLIPSIPDDGDDYSVPDGWGKTKTRRVAARFSGPVMQRSNSACVVCGTTLASVVEAAHLSPYAADPKNRANPANGVCLCAYCHRVLDRRLIAIQPNGELLVSSSVEDTIAEVHFSRIQPDTRSKWLEGVNPRFLELTVRWFKENVANNQVERMR